MEDPTSVLVDLSQYELDGLCDGYELRRSRYEARANAGSHEARRDWTQNIGPISEFGVCNPVNGNLIAILFPLSKPERLHALAYIVEYIFLYDSVLDEAPSVNPSPSSWQRSPREGHTRLQSKILMLLTTIDAPCGHRVKRAWKKCLNTTLHEKPASFNTLQEYLDYRIIDAGTPVAEALMLWGISLVLSPSEDALLAPIRTLCFSALTLTNDLFSFELEFASMQSTGAETLTNAVWLHMQWYGVDAGTAKDMVRDVIIKYEQEFLAASRALLEEMRPTEEKLERYLTGLMYQISGNAVWHMNAPRYWKEFRYDANAGIEDEMTMKYRLGFAEEEDEEEEDEEEVSD